MKKLGYWTILIILLYGFMELFSYGGLLFLNKFQHLQYKPIDLISTQSQEITNRFINGESSYTAFDATLGWSIKENGSSELYKANSSGIRSDREYTIAIPRGVRRITAFGDSFTHCNDVKNNETWEAVMESYNSNLEVLNFGVSGYGLDQAYLRYLEQGRHYQSDIVLIGFMSENINRNVNNYRPFYRPDTRTPLTKPRYIIKDGNLSLIPNPMKSLSDYKELLHSRDALARIGESDYFYKRHYSSNKLDWSPTVKLLTVLIQNYYEKLSSDGIMINGSYNEKSEAFNITKKIFDAFYSASIKNNSQPIILVFPDKEDVAQYRKNKQESYSALLKYFDSAGYRYIDLMRVFDNVDAEEFFAEHYTAQKNKLVANYIFNYINNIRPEKTNAQHAP